MSVLLSFLLRGSTDSVVRAYVSPTLNEKMGPGGMMWESFVVRMFGHECMGLRGVATRSHWRINSNSRGFDWQNHSA
ncbi:hypothetical protein SKAU_G00160330 [Synaphobranchus kaupii]|uniref:Uncharacterized protein n=1 Tax=Synaphobranchus kaupii TaxID=118154 RepID=A0A9Q1IZC5_SYNKA|nr:hypothetical protein SKAU_G00160330 [Synaphobranchus kaupii]